MLDAISMYSGEIFYARDCDYEDCKKHGLICPFCDSALFLRAESTRNIGGKLKLFNAYFAHYATGTPDNWDCEKRSHSKAGRQHIERLKVQARNQRLKLYNAYFWDLFCRRRSDKRRIQVQLNEVRSLFGDKWCQQRSIEVRKEWERALPDVYTFIDASVKDIRVRADDAGNLEHHLLQEGNAKRHQVICNEIAEFLASNTAGYAFEKLFKYCLWVAYDLRKLSISEWKKMPPVAHIAGICIAIAATHWIEAIQEKREEEKLDDSRYRAIVPSQSIRETP